MSDQNNQGSEIYDHELNQETKNIIMNCQEIMTNIELEIPIQTIDDLYQEGIYIEMFKKMFPFMKKKIEQIEENYAPTGKKLQKLINGLSNDVLTMDLTHIKGQAIADKDPRHLLNFLQIILELSKLYNLKKDPNHEIAHTEGNNQEIAGSDEDNHHQADVEEELYANEDQDAENVNPNINSNYANQRDNSQNQSGQPKLNKNQSFKNLMQGDKKQIENDIYSNPNQRVITNDPNIQQTFQNQNYEHEEEEELYENNDNEQNLLKIQELYNLYKSGALSVNDPQFYELQEILAAHGMTIEQLDDAYNNQNMQIQNDGNESAISRAVEESRAKLQRMSNYKSRKVDQTDEKVKQGQQKYQTFLKNYKKDFEKKMKKKHSSSSNIDYRKEERKKRISEHEDRMLQKEYQDEQLSLHIQMRDRKLQYVRNIHKIIFELEKKKIIDEQNEYKENKEKLEADAKNRLISIENKYKDRILMLKEALEQQRKDRHIQEVAQRQELSRQERELKQIKRKQIEDLKDYWRSEREKFDLITKDDRKLESEILELYKKY